MKRRATQRSRPPPPLLGVLFDEIEKRILTCSCSSQVLMMAGLRTGRGRTIDFKNAIFIMTSNNIGSPIIQEFYNEKKLGPQDRLEMEQWFAR